VSAQLNISVKVNEVALQFPNGVTFRLDAVSNSEIESIVLNYGTNARTCQNNSGHQRVDFNPSSKVNVEWEWDWQRSGILPPGAKLWWQWEIKDKSGSSRTTAVKRVEIQDHRHEWQFVNRDGVTVQWYLGNEDFGYALLKMVSDSLVKIEEDIGLASAEEINLIVYPNSKELHETLLVTTEWTGGVAMSDFGSIVAAIGPDELEWAARAIPHEVTHLVVASTVHNCKGVFIPAWLNEGISEVIENPPTEEEHKLINEALENDTLPDMCSLERGFSAYGNSAHLSYVQSKFIVNYLINEYGADNLEQLLLTLQKGERINPAMQKIYGFDTKQLDDVWRSAMGYQRGKTESKIIYEEGKKTPTPVPTIAFVHPVNQVKTTAVSTHENVFSTPTATAENSIIKRTKKPTPNTPVQNHPPDPPKKQDPAGYSGIFYFLVGGAILLMTTIMIHKKWKG
jgi:hypothetical protein